jgi:hypothetical protein
MKFITLCLLLFGFQTMAVFASDRDSLLSALHQSMEASARYDQQKLQTIQSLQSALAGQIQPVSSTLQRV